MGKRYWIANSAGNWNDSANWSLTRSGTGPADPPTSLYDSDGSPIRAIFTEDHVANCTLTAAISIYSLESSGYTGTINLSSFNLTSVGDVVIAHSAELSGLAGTTWDVGGHLVLDRAITQSRRGLSLATNWTIKNAKIGSVIRHATIQRIIANECKGDIQCPHSTDSGNNSGLEFDLLKNLSSSGSMNANGDGKLGTSGPPNVAFFGSAETINTNADGSLRPITLVVI